VIFSAIRFATSFVFPVRLNVKIATFIEVMIGELTNRFVRILAANDRSLSIH
jgi:hypothetical protein